MTPPSRPIKPTPESIVRLWNNKINTGSVVYTWGTRPTKGETPGFPDWIHPKLLQALRDRGIDSPYSHQLSAWNYLHNQEDTVIATPTASGKTLGYNVPVLNQLLRLPQSTAMYLFPTKALARDQEKSISDLISKTDSAVKVATYDGDTPAEARRSIRSGANVVITNPDMLHMGILPHHSDWASFLSSLAFVILDELHMYRGVFGSHVANVIRRLDRIAHFHGARPVFATCSATIANPRELAKQITGRTSRLVDQSTAPQGERLFAVYNPAPVDETKGVRRSSLKETAKLATDLIRSGLQTLVFCQSRKSVELVLTYIRDRLKKQRHADGSRVRGQWHADGSRVRGQWHADGSRVRGQWHADGSRVRGYRGGYLPQVRREIEEAFRNAELDAVVATNALELGIDIGSLDAVIMCGYPGTIAGLHQRAGRAGRTLDPSLAVLVTSANPVDQFLAKNPPYLTAASPEKALTEPDNVEILLSHLKCAIFELPLSLDETFGGLQLTDLEAAIDCLREDGDIVLSNGRAHYVGDAYPASQISLRAISSGTVVVSERESGALVAQVDTRTAKVELHADAVYIADGETFYVEELDLTRKQAVVSRISPTHYTVPHRRVGVSIVETEDQKGLPGGSAARGVLAVTETITGFKKVRLHTHENLGFQELTLPPEEMETDGIWISPSANLRGLLTDYSRAVVMEGMEAVGYAVHQVASLHLMCDLRDLSYTVQSALHQVSEEHAEPEPTLFLYDAHAGGVGLSRCAYDSIEDILTDGLALISGCPCKSGCPSCIGPRDSTGANTKDAALALTKGWLGPIGVQRWAGPIGVRRHSP